MSVVDVSFHHRGTEGSQRAPDDFSVKENRDSAGDCEGDHLFLICEIKGTKDKAGLRPDERRKIDCGRRHFKDAPKIAEKLFEN